MGKRGNRVNKHESVTCLMNVFADWNYFDERRPSLMNAFFDMHVHSKFSIDGVSTMEDYCLIAEKSGIRAFLVKPNIGGLFLLGKPCSHTSSFPCPCHAIGAFFGCFLRLLTWRKQHF